MIKKNISQFSGFVWSEEEVTPFQFLFYYRDSYFAMHHVDTYKCFLGREAKSKSKGET